MASDKKEDTKLSLFNNSVYWAQNNQWKNTTLLELVGKSVLQVNVEKVLL